MRNGARYLVDVKGRSMLVEAGQLTRVERQTRRAGPADRPATAGVPAQLIRSHAPASIDLHGMTVEHALPALDTFLSEAILGGLADVHVIHGRSGGRLKDAVHRRLKELPSIRAFRVDPANPGLTIVHL